MPALPTTAGVIGRRLPVLAVMKLRRFVTGAHDEPRPSAARRDMPVIVPEVRGLSARQARSAIKREGLKMTGPPIGLTGIEAGSSGLADFSVGQLLTVLFHRQEAGSRRVVAQSPSGGSAARRGDTIVVWYGDPGHSPAVYS